MRPKRKTKRGMVDADADFDGIEDVEESAA
jgi:hypothetical protein